MSVLRHRIEKLEGRLPPGNKLPWWQVIVEPGESLDAVCEREGVDREKFNLIVYEIVDPSQGSSQERADTQAAAVC